MQEIRLFTLFSMAQNYYCRIFVLFLGLLLLGCTTPRHIVKLDTPIRNQSVKLTPIRVNSFNIVTTRRDRLEQKQAFLDEVTQYLQYNQSILDLQKRYPDLAFDISIKPGRDIKRTWILDAAFFWPYVGTWPFTPWWGTTSVKIEIQATIPDVDRAVFNFNQDNNFSILLYPYYRAGKLFTRDYKALYTNLLGDISGYDFAKNWTGSHAMVNHGNPEKKMVEAAPQSDVDVDIPENYAINDKTFILIIGNEDYSNEISVPFARNDAWAFRQYAQRTLGIPEKNIRSLENATYGQMLTSIDWLSNVIKAFEGEAKAIFYYAGHGMPDQATSSAYLLPADGSSSNLTSALKLEYLYSKLAANPSQGVTVILDACFSGNSRTEMLTAGRGVKIRPKQESIPGSLVVLSATSADETAFPLTEKQHGLFTYYILKKLKETSGNVTLKELSSYVAKNVTRQAILINDKPQTPQVNYGAQVVAQWGDFSLR